MICECCENEFDGKIYQYKGVNCCSRSCYNRVYYIKNKIKRKNYFSERHYNIYKPHPIEPKYKTKEEKEEATKLLRKKYYEEHKERYRELNRQWYAKNKDNPDVKRRHAKAMKKYYKKLKKLNKQRLKQSI